MMIRRLTYALGLSLALAAAGCKGTENVTGRPAGGGGTESRTLESMLPGITKSLTPTLAEERFGLPNSGSNSTPLILVYFVEDGKKVNLGFPSRTEVISYASWQDKNGVVTGIPLRD
jgi:hypothetical protein